MHPWLSEFIITSGTIPHALTSANEADPFNSRAGRVSCAQRLGLKNRELYHCADWDAPDFDPTPFRTLVGKWLVHHDPEQYAYDNYEACASHLTAGTLFENTNAVPGFPNKPWTVQELLEASDHGEKIVDEGDWF